MIAKHDEALPGMPEPPRVVEEPWDELAGLAVQLRCEHCKAAPHDWCRTRTGHGAANLHAARTLVVRTVFWLGYAHGFEHGGDVASEQVP